MKFTCKKCGHADYRLEKRGTQTALLCARCGFWQKWIDKNDLHKYGTPTTNTEELPDTLIINGVKYRKEAL
jgi:Zn ribbon nucleic-acid-binding protein